MSSQPSVRTILSGEYLLKRGAEVINAEARALHLLADSLEHAGSADKEKLIAALNTSTFKAELMPYGPTKFVNGQNEGAQPVNTQIRGDKIEVIFPKEFATAAPVFPNPSKG